jgi:uncharacterized membrane protein HdeD (DUF308 family)
MANSMTDDMRKATTWSIVLSLLMVAAGVVAIWAPGVAGVTVTLLVGWLLIFSGFLHFGFAWRASGAGAIMWEILLGIVYGAIGLYLLVNPGAGLTSLTLAIAIYLLIEGVVEFILAFQLRPMPGSGWLLFDGIVTLVLAVLIWRTWPSNTPWVIGTLVGISMLFSGITRFMLTMSARRAVA